MPGRILGLISLGLFLSAKLQTSIERKFCSKLLIYFQVFSFRVDSTQANQLEGGFSLLEKLFAVEEELGNRPERMMVNYDLAALLSNAVS